MVNINFVSTDKLENIFNKITEKLNNELSQEDKKKILEGYKEFLTELSEQNEL